MFFRSPLIASTLMNNADDLADASTPITLTARVDQAALGFGSDASDYSDLFSVLSCSESDLSEFFMSEMGLDVRTIEGSDRLYSSRNPIYLLPLDEEEFHRLDKQDFLLRLGMWELLSLRNDIEEVIGKAGVAQNGKAVLDVGCGSGHWIKNMASANKEVRFVGIDQAVQVLEETQPNVEFQRHDVNSGLEPYHGSFDLVHVRCIGSGISSYRSLLEEATRCLKPGGLAIFVEGDFDLLKEDQRTIQEPASDENPNGSWLQKWMQAVRMAQVHRRGIIDSDNSPELLDIGLWQFDAYEPSSCYTASVLTPITPWPRSDLQEEDLHFKVAGVLMRQNLKLFVTGTEQLMVEDGHPKEEMEEWRSRIMKEIEDEGFFKNWFRWRVAWGRVPSDPLSTSNQVPTEEAIASVSSRPQVLPSEKRIRARQHLMSRIREFTLQQCHVRNQHESLAYVHQRENDPLSTRNRF